MISGFNYNREIAQLRIAQEFHESQIERIEERIEELGELMVPGSGKTERAYIITKLGQRLEHHHERVVEIKKRIQEIESKSDTPNDYPRAEFEEQDEDKEPSFAEFFGLTQEEADAARNAAEKFAVGEFEEPVKDELNLFDPDDWPPQFHIDNLEMQLDFNLGQVYGFCDLDKQSQADLAKLAVEYELDKESVQNILNICRELGSLDGDRD